MTTAQKIITVLLLVVAAATTKAVMMQAGASTLMQHIFVLCIAVAIDKVCRCPSYYYRRSTILDEDISPETDEYIIRSYMKKSPTGEELRKVEEHLNRNRRRETAEERGALTGRMLL